MVTVTGKHTLIALNTGTNKVNTVNEELDAIVLAGIEWIYYITELKKILLVQRRRRWLNYNTI